ncbi:hypothetical protein [Amycolatopsis sp. CA-230715]|uniref:hypothetical protein n=1 Tax=Amycolatopsis sp. CA-230715 TaxID=2745196 RepID=UPI001C02402E|nr:hypothetical protein [Amycolatopsis sp. CA-230715]QWF78388.1 hypothetical protein HUW46_01784 [Amycolatopsis sp. CA-230715]
MTSSTTGTTAGGTAGDKAGRSALNTARKALRAGDTAPARALLATTRTDPDRREHHVGELSKAGAEQLALLGGALEEQPGDPDLLLLLGVALVTAAKNARGSARASALSDGQVRDMFSLGREAREHLRAAVKAAPEDPVPWAALMRIAQLAPEREREWREAFAQVTERAPLLYGANMTALGCLTRKWHGSEAEQAAFAAERAAAAPDGHPLLALVPMSHIESYVDGLMRGNVVVRIGRVLMQRRLKKRRARTEVNTASERLLTSPLAHPSATSAHQVFATYYHRVHDTKRLRAHLERSGPKAIEFPAAYFGDHVKLFAEARAAAGLAPKT